jgi:hypothetical protein
MIEAVLLGVCISLSLISMIMVAVFCYVFIKEVKDLKAQSLKVIEDAKESLKTASSINQALAVKVETIEDSVKVLDFYRNQGKK